MSAKVSRKTTAQSSASSSTMYSTPQETTSHHRSRSPLSPTRVSRMAEKAELQGLNDRLAVYMQTVRALEKENSQLVKQVEMSQETINKEKTAYRSMYEQELSDARRMLDDIAGNRARLEIENKRLREENEDLKSGFDKSTKECRKLEANLNVLEHRFADLQTKYNKVASDLKAKEEDLRDFDKIKRQLEQQKKFVENETLARVELENKLQSLKEEINFKQHVYEQEVTQLRTKRSQEISEIDGRLTVEYDERLQEALRELRDQYNAQCQANREEIVELYENKLRRLEEHNKSSLSSTQATVEELRAVQTRFELTASQLSSLEASNSNLAARVRDLERQLELERTRSVERLAAVEQELALSRDEMTSQLKDYQELMEIKVALDSELSAYRKMLELEELRLNINPNVTSPLAAGRRGTPQRRGVTPLGKASKRRRIVLDETEQCDSFQVTGEARTDIEISDVDPEGKFVQLHNKGEKELVIGGWTIKHTVGGEGGEETSFKLHRSVKIESRGNVTVWAADAGRTHEPPQHIVMKQKWFSGDPAFTVLSNSDGEEVARRERTRVQSSSYRHEYDDETDRVDPTKQECLIM